MNGLQSPLRRLAVPILALLAAVILDARPTAGPVASSGSPGGFNRTSPQHFAFGLSLSPTLSWSASNGATRYEYCLDTLDDEACTGGWTSVGNVLSATVTGLSPGTAYFWHVRAFDADPTPTYSNGSSVGYWRFTTLSNPSSFGKSSPANGTTGVSTSPALSWQSSEPAVTYEYCIDTTNDDACTAWTPSVSAGTVPVVFLENLQTNTTYYWQVRATNSNQNPTYANGAATAFWSFTTQTDPPGAFGKVTPMNGATGVLTIPTLTWSPSSGATSYEYCIDVVDDGICGGTWTSVGTAQTASPSLFPGTRYYWQVRARNATATQTYADGASTATWGFRTQLGPPGPFNRVSPLNGAVNQPTTLTLSWTPSNSADAFEYCLDTVNDDVCTTTWINVGDTLSTTVSGLSPSTTYYWHVRAFNSLPSMTYANVNGAPFRNLTTIADGSGAFGKIAPADGQLPPQLILAWSPSANAVNYEYCYDTINDNACSDWRSVGNASTVTLVGVAFSTTYYWQVRATNNLGAVTYANYSAAAFWSFRTPAQTSTLIATPAALTFGATKSGLTLTNVTPPQTVAVVFAGSAPMWTASSDVSWLVITNGAGRTGHGSFGVSIGNPAAIGSATTLHGTITLSAATALPVQIPVTLNVDQTAVSSLPAFGQIDTPAQNATGQVGAVGVTGWALDDVGVMSVKIYRSCVTFDNPASCQSMLGRSVVFIGDAAFLPGARADVEAAYPGWPYNYRAGWGMQVLTNMLPHMPTGRTFGGQGTIDLYAFATDVEGHVTLLGRSATDATPTTISLDNDNIAKPFGTADTPALGSTVSSFLLAYIWALTPDADATSGNGDIEIAPTGATTALFIDGVSLGAPLFANRCRGNVGSPPPAGVYCNDDIASIFGHATPQPVLTPRASNPTRFRNLDAGRGSLISTYYLTTGIPNGIHTLAWSVTDSAGRVEGIGSRFFYVANGSSLVAQIVSLLVADAAPAMSRGRADALRDLRVSRRPLSVRTGFDQKTVPTELPPGRDGVRYVTVSAGGRVEIALGGKAIGGYLETNAELRDLPIGSHLDLATGVFTWTPTASFFGTYRLVLLIDGEQVVVAINIGKG